MNDHEKFKSLMSELGILSYHELAELVGLKYQSVKSLMAPSKPMPTWARSMLIVYNRMKEKQP